MSYELEGDKGYGLKKSSIRLISVSISNWVSLCMKLLSSIKTPRHSDARKATPL